MNRWFMNDFVPGCSQSFTGHVTLTTSSLIGAEQATSPDFQYWSFFTLLHLSLAIVLTFEPASTYGPLSEARLLNYRKEFMNDKVE